MRQKSAVLSPKRGTFGPLEPPGASPGPGFQPRRVPEPSFAHFGALLELFWALWELLWGPFGGHFEAFLATEIPSDFGPRLGRGLGSF